MKKIVTLFTALMLTLSSAFAFMGCGLFDDKTDDEGNGNLASEKGAVSTKCIAQINDDYLDTMESFYDDDDNFWIFDMGMLVNVPLDDVINYYPYSGGKVTYKYSVSSTTASSIKITTQQAAARSTTWSESATTSVKFNLSAGQKDIFGVSIEDGLSVTSMNGGSNSYSWSKGFESCEQQSKTEEQSVTITFDESCEYGYYSYRFLGSVEVFAVVIQDRKTKEYIATTYTQIKGYGYSLDFDPDSPQFNNYDTSRFDFDLSMLPDLPEPIQYVDYLEIAQASGKKPITVYESTIRTGSEKIRGSGKYTLDSFTISKSIEDLIDAGYKRLSFEIEYDLKEVDNCKQYISLFTSTNIPIRNETTYHGGSSTKKSWETHYLSCNILLVELDSNIFNFRCQAEDKMWRDFYIGTVKVRVTAK